MDILVRRAIIIDPSSPFHQQQADILIQNGFVADIGTLSSTADQIIERPGLHLSPGWLDTFAHFSDPGFEYKETLETGARAAAAGGYTDVMILPNTSPVLHNKAGIEYVTQRSRKLPVNLHPIGAVTKNADGKELAEMYDMQQSGAVAFSDGSCTIQSPGILLKALQYIRAISKTIIQIPDDRSVGAGGLMSEGIVSTQLGLPGKPAIGEELMVMRDIELTRYTGSRIHLTGISTARSVQLIREAKSAGINVSCSVTPAHLFFTDEDLVHYDTNLKLDPPLRTEKDREALRSGLQDGTIDCIATHHLPQDKDHKVVEFEYAQPGMIGLETSFAAVSTALPSLSMEQLLSIFSTRPRQLFDLPLPEVRKGSAAAFSMFLPDEAYTPARFRSKSMNSAFLGKPLRGLPVGIINKDNLFLNE